MGIPVVMFPSGPKDYPSHPELERPELDRNSSLALMVEMIGSGRRVLDVGCASGYLAKLLVTRGCTVVGIDASPAAVEAAAAHCTRAIVADLDDVRLPDLLEGERFEVVVFGDVLEHLNNPSRLLDDARAVLDEGGHIVASVPNIAHGAVRLAMLAGRFDYQEFGLLDETHVRFFTAKSLDELFLTSGYRVERIERTTLPVFEPSDLVPKIAREDFGEETIAEVERDPECATLQFVVRAAPLADDERHREIARRFLAANTDLASAAGRLEAQARTIDAARAELEETRGYLERADREMRAAQERALAMEADRAAERLEIAALREEVEVLRWHAADLSRRIAEGAAAKPKRTRRPKGSEVDRPQV